MWTAAADYADGAHIEKRFPYQEGASYIRENERQYQFECWLIEQAEKHGGIEWYSVTYEQEDEQ